MLNLLKNFATQHFEAVPNYDHIIVTKDHKEFVICSCQSDKNVKLIPLFSTSCGRLCIEEINGDHKIKVECENRVENVKELVLKLQREGSLSCELAHYITDVGIEDIWKFELKPLPADFVLDNSSFKVALEELREGVNFNIDMHETKIKELRKAYSLLKGLEKYSIQP